MEQIKEKQVWTVTPSGNMILKGKDFYISFNDMKNTLVSAFPFFRSDDGNVETALTSEDLDGFIVLNGDFREECEKLYPDYDKIKKFFLEKMKTNASTWSNYGNDNT